MMPIVTGPTLPPKTSVSTTHAASYAMRTARKGRWGSVVASTKDIAS